MSKIKVLLIVFSILALFVQSVFAGDEDRKNPENPKPEKEETKPVDDDEDDDDLGSDFKIDYEVEIHGRFNSDDRGNHNTRISKSFVRLSPKWQNWLRAVFTLKLDQILHTSEEGNQELSYEIQEFLEDAYIEIRTDIIAGKAVAVILGKHALNLGNGENTTMPCFENSPLFHLQTKHEVFGITLVLEDGLFGLIDEFEISWFESEEGDLEIGQMDGVSVRMSRMLSEEWNLNLSYLTQGNSHIEGAEREHRGTIGLVYQNWDGSFIGYIEGIIFSNNPEYPDADVAIQIGASFDIHDAVQVVVEYNIIFETMQEIGIGVRTYLTKRIAFGAEIRYQNYMDASLGKEDGFVFGVDLTVILGTTEESEFENYLFE